MIFGLYEIGLNGMEERSVVVVGEDKMKWYGAWYVMWYVMWYGI